MAELDYNQIFKGVRFALQCAFPEVQVHGGVITQDLKPGDFNVLPISTSEIKQIGTRAQRSITFDVIYYPLDTGNYEAYLDMQNRLPGVIGTITTPNGDKVHCLKVESNITDDALHCVVSYSYSVYTIPDGDAMETLTIL